MHYVPSIHAWMSACQYYAQHTFFLFRLFCIHMLLYHTYSYVSIYLTVTFIHTMSPMCVCLSLPISLWMYGGNIVHMNVTDTKLN